MTRRSKIEYWRFIANEDDAMLRLILDGTIAPRNVKKTIAWWFATESYRRALHGLVDAPKTRRARKG